MPTTTTSPNMSLIIPTVSQDPGPDWAGNLNASLSIIDQHTHAPGSGIQITPEGMNISSDLSFSSNNATLLRSARFDIQSAALADATDLGCAYAVGDDGDLYYNDGLGNQIQITANGGVAGSPGSIASLTSPASASWVSATATFVWKSTALLAANMDAATLIVRYPGSYPTPSGNYIAIQAPSSLASGYAITLPALPASASFLTISTSGTLAGGPALANGITRSNLEPVGQQISSSCGASDTITSTSFTDITNLSVAITSTGRPVRLFLQPDGTANAGRFNVDADSTVAEVRILRDGSSIAVFEVRGPQGTGVIDFLDTPAGALYAYKVQAKVVTGTSVSPRYMKLVAYEL